MQAGRKWPARDRPPATVADLMPEVKQKNDSTVPIFPFFRSACPTGNENSFAKTAKKGIFFLT